MSIDPVVVIVLIVVVALALYAGKILLADRTAKRDMRQVETDRREERAHQERLEKERMARIEEARQEEAGAMEAARKQMALAQQEMHEVKESFRAYHDQLIEDIHLQAKAGCDAIFRNRFGITRPPKAENPQDDPEVREYLRNHYAELRDAALAHTVERLMADEVDARIAALDAEADAQEEQDAAELEAEAAVEAETETEVASETEAEAEAEPETTTEIETKAEPEDEATPDETLEEPGEAPEEPEEEPGLDRTPFEEAVREEFDLDSIRTYLLAAISARYDENGRPIGELPWPAYTSISPRGFGELVLAQGAPLYAQDAYRDFAWKKFHTGRRAEKPQRGEYSWPASHELGDGVALESLPTPAGSFSVTGPNGPLPLYELIDCTWMRHSLDYKDALLVPDVQRSFFVKLEGLRKDETLQLRFDGPDFLTEAEDGSYFLNALGEVNGAHVGISASKPEAANLGEAPYELSERTPTGFTFRMTHDARRYDRDTYPQFLEVHLAWCQPPSPRPDRIIRHVAN